jgi:AAA domain
MENNSGPVDRTRYINMTKEECLQAFKRTIAHPHLVKADKALSEALQEPGGASIVNVFGPARVGKSTMKNHVIRAVLLELLPTLQQDRERVPLISLMPRPPLSGYFNWKDFFQEGLVAFDEPLISYKIAFDTEEDEGQFVESRSKRNPPQGTKDALRQSFETATKRRRSVAIFIDEAQHLGKVSSDRQLQNQLDCIKSLAENTGTIIVLIGTYQLLPLRNLSAQLIGRSLDIHFPRYRNTEKEVSQFKNVLWTFQNALPFVEETDILLKHWEFCYERSIGCVGNLRLMLVRAVHAALWTDAKTLSWNHLKTHAFSEAESYEMMLEAYKGERELASKPDQHAKLRKMLGLAPHITSKTVPQTDETASDLQPTQQSQAENIVEELGQGLLPAEFPADEDSSTSQPASDTQSDETTNRPEEGSEAQETPSAEALPKPLNKPKAEIVRPFRRKAHRDRTGGFHKENKGRD